MPQVINALARALVYVVLVLATIPTMHTTAAADTATPGTGAAYTGAAWGAGAMQPEPVAHTEYAGYVHQIGEQVADMGDVINAPGVEDYGWILEDIGQVLAGTPHLLDPNAADLNGDGVIRGDIELGA